MRALLWAATMLFAAAAPVAAQTQTPSPAPSQAPPELARELAPEGAIRVAINFGNSVLAQRDANGEPAGISVDLARELSRRTGLPLQFIPFDAAGRVFDALKENRWDVAFLAVEPVRAAEIEFSPPYVVIDGSYMVPKDSPLKTNADVDRAGVRIAVGRGSAYDLYLSRTIKNATLVRAPTSPAAIDLFVADKLDVAANVRLPLLEYAKKNPQYVVLDGAFQTIQQAMGAPKGRLASAVYLTNLIEELKASGFVAAAIERHKQATAQVAPAGAAK